MENPVEAVLHHLDEQGPGGVIGAYLYGSSVEGGLRPDSDVDLLVLTRRSLEPGERRGLVDVLLGVSGWSGHDRRFPEVADRRAVDLTTVVISQHRQWLADRVRDFQYGEWLRSDLLGGRVPQPAEDPDVVLLVAAAITSHRVLRGPALGDVVGAVPPDALRQACLDVMPTLLEGVSGDERNTLLTLARILVTLSTGRIVPKDEAAVLVAPGLPVADRELLDLARSGYLGEADDDWSGHGDRVAGLARRLADRAQSL